MNKDSGSKLALTKLASVKKDKPQKGWLYKTNASHIIAVNKRRQSRLKNGGHFLKRAASALYNTIIYYSYEIKYTFSLFLSIV